MLFSFRMLTPFRVFLAFGMFTTFGMFPSFRMLGTFWMLSDFRMFGLLSGFFLFLYGDPAQGFDSFLSLEKLKAYDRLYEQAIAAVSDNPDLIQRVSAARISIE